MSRIRVLSAEIVDRIAAGEVVERPASVVKELVENALDAGAQRIAVRVEAGGTRSIEVEDDGHGMDAEDARMAFEQHATSKISAAEQLDEIESLGFRGEALPSIASVSRVEMTTGTGEGPGVRLRLEGGRVESATTTAWPRGTTVRVRDLFYNTPARRKHLRTESTEFRHVAGVLEDYALARPDLHLTLHHGDRRRLSATPVDGLRERVHQVFGREVAEDWIGVDYSVAGTRVHGGVAGPEQGRSHRRDVRLFVNGRPISDARLAHALGSAYENLLESGRHPVAVLYLDVPRSEVDVNVHPRKAEVRFVHHGRVYGAVRTAVRRALDEELPPATVRAREAAGGRATAPGEAGTDERPGEGEGGARHAGLPLKDWMVMEGTGAGTADEEAEAGAFATPAWSGSSDREAGGKIAGTRGPIQPLAQYANTYILAADAEGLLIIDQHVAHERILYEQVLRQSGEERLAAQRLLVPETLELTAEEAEAAAEQRELIESFGFELEEFGGTTWAVRSAPAVLEGRRIGDAVRSLLRSLPEGAGPEALEEARSRASASVACHAAVRANQPLSREVMAYLVEELGRCEAATRCPHGRPVLLRVDLGEIERRLGRT